MYDIGASYPGHVFWKEEPFDNDVLPTDQFSGKRYSLSELPDGGVKIYCEDEDWFYAFYRESKTTAKIQQYYPADYYSSEKDAYEWSGMHMTLQDLGWLAISRDLRLREPFQKLNWGQWVINADGNNYLLTGTDYDGFNHLKRFQEDIIGNHDCTLPIVRMNNYGEEKDYANVDVHGKIVVVDRGGGVTFFERMVYASKAGAIAVMCANNYPGAVHPNMLGNLPDGVERIPFVTITQEAGEKLNGQTTVHFIYTDDPDSIRY